MKTTRLAALTLAGAFVAAGASLSAATMTLKGTVSDAMCGAKHPVADAAECTKTCVKKGSDYALIADGGKVYTLKADAPAKAELDKLAGKMAEVSGDVNGMTVMVKSVKMGMIKK
jgi:predicted type IV restriction endonuclease